MGAGVSHVFLENTKPFDRQAQQKQLEAWLEEKARGHMCTEDYRWEEYQQKEPEFAAQFKRAVMDKKLPEGWAPLFQNKNDGFKRWPKSLICLTYWTEHRSPFHRVSS